MTFARRLFISVGLIACAALAIPAAGAAASTPAGSGASGGWGDARMVPTPPKTGSGVTSYIACTPGGYCGAVGEFGTHLFVLTARKGAWGKPQIVSNHAAGIRPTANVGFTAVSCPSWGNCVATGTFYIFQNFLSSFVVSQKHGVWGKPEILDSQGIINSVACTSAGNCEAGGYYISNDGNGSMYPSVVSERNGVWGYVSYPRGLSTSKLKWGLVSSIACIRGKSCLAFGLYADKIPQPSPWWVATARNGRWSAIASVPGLPSDAFLVQVSCVPEGTCTLAGTPPPGQVFTISETNGTWGPLNMVPEAALPAGGTVSLTSLSCVSPGNCAVTGMRSTPGGGQPRPFVAAERNGTWASIETIPGLAVLLHNRDFKNSISLVSCGAAGNCAAIGWANLYVTATKVTREAFVVNLAGGRWHWARIVPGITRLGNGASEGLALACWAADHCAAGGFFQRHPPHAPAYVSRYPFVVTQG